jgi:hypothetical protein
MQKWFLLLILVFVACVKKNATQSGETERNLLFPDCLEDSMSHDKDLGNLSETLEDHHLLSPTKRNNSENLRTSIR